MEIREWVETRSGRPAMVEGTEGQGSGLLRVDFGEQDESLVQVGWDEWFKTFEESDLAFVYQDEAEDGSPSYLCKIVSRNDDTDPDTIDAQASYESDDTEGDEDDSY